MAGKIDNVRVLEIEYSIVYDRCGEGWRVQYLFGYNRCNGGIGAVSVWDEGAFRWDAKNSRAAYALNPRSLHALALYGGDSRRGNHFPAPEQQRHHGHGGWAGKFRTVDAAAGNRSNYGGKHRHHNHGLAGITDIGESGNSILFLSGDRDRFRADGSCENQKAASAGRGAAGVRNSVPRIDAVKEYF